MCNSRSALLPPVDPPPRHTTLDLPPYRHVPGLTPHPVRHPDGHAFGEAQSVISPSCQGLPDSWPNCQDYLLGVDLFNHNYLWEAHEAWEVVWIGAGKVSGPGLLAQGLIQVSAALLRLHLDTPSGALSLLGKARSRFDRLPEFRKPDEHRYMGVAIDDWWSSVLRFAHLQSARFPFISLED